MHLHPSHGSLDFLLSPSLPDGNLLGDMTQGGQVVIGEVGAAQDLMTGRHFKLSGAIWDLSVTGSLQRVDFFRHTARVGAGGEENQTIELR